MVSLSLASTSIVIAAPLVVVAWSFTAVGQTGQVTVTVTVAVDLSQPVLQIEYVKVSVPQKFEQGV